MKEFHTSIMWNQIEVDMSPLSSQYKNDQDYPPTLHCPQSTPSALDLQTQSPVHLSHRLELLTVPRWSHWHTANRAHVGECHQSSGHTVERQIVNRGDSGSNPPTIVSKPISFTPHLPVSFGRDAKSRWSLLAGVYARGSKRSHTGVNV